MKQKRFRKLLMGQAGFSRNEANGLIYALKALRLLTKADLERLKAKMLKGGCESESGGYSGRGENIHSAGEQRDI